jgi:C4-dicarboxylate transporter DctQ subunit
VFLGFNIAVALAMMTVVVYGVVMRYVFNIPARWVGEMSEFMMVALSFLALGYVQRQRQHITIDFLLIKQSEITKTVLLTITTLCALVIFVLLTWASWGFALKAWQSGFTSDAASLPLFPPRLLVPIGSGVLCLQLMADLIQEIGSLLSHKVST